MANRAVKPCRKAGCSALTREGFCDAHKPKYQRGGSAAYHSLYNLPVWTQDLRPAQLLREPFCAQCLREGKRQAATVVDHIRPHRGDVGLFLDASNHQSLCKRHHDRKTAQEQQETRRKATYPPP